MTDLLITISYVGDLGRLRPLTVQLGDGYDSQDYSRSEQSNQIKASLRVAFLLPFLRKAERFRLHCERLFATKPLPAPWQGIAYAP